MNLLRSAGPPLPLAAASALVAAEGVVFVGYGVVELLSLSTDRISVALTTGLFFAGYGAGLLACAWALSRMSSWARSPVVFAQLLQLGVAWGFRGGETTYVAVALAVVSVLVLAGVFHPASLRVLSEDEAT